MAIVLIITTNDGQLIELPILGKCTLGRSSSCDLALDDKEMSGKHGAFEINKQGQLVFSDLGSTNGSFLNDVKIQKTQFQLGQKIRLGNTTIIIDEKRLNANEKANIGKYVEKVNTVAATQPDKLVDNLTTTKTVASEKPKTVILNKELKQKDSTKSWGQGKDNIFEADENSESSISLQLDKKTGKKK